MCKANQCVTCGKNIPEGDHLCNVCKSIITEPKKDIPIDDFIEVRTAAAKIKEFCLTRIHKNKNGCRYKALGNSLAIPCALRVIGYIADFERTTERSINNVYSYEKMRKSRLQFLLCRVQRIKSR